MYYKLLVTRFYCIHIYTGNNSKKIIKIVMIQTIITVSNNNNIPNGSVSKFFK